MGIVRKILIFLVLTAGIIMLGRLAPRIVPRFLTRIHPDWTASKRDVPPNSSLSADSLRDSTNALPEVVEDTTGGKWQQKLFDPLLRSYGLPEKHLKPKKGYFEIVLPKGKPIHEYALEIEKLCRQNEITVEQGVELHPSGRSVEYRLASNGQHIKLRASLGGASMAGSAKLALVFIALDSLKENDLAGLETAKWDKSLVVDPYSPNPVLKKLRFTSPRNEVLLELPMEPSTYPYVDPGKHALFIHHTKEEVGKILSEGFDSLPKAAGFVTKYGDRAIENQPLLDKVFQYTAGKHLVFLDLTGSPRSLSRQSAAAQGAHCRNLSAYPDSLHVDEELVRRAVLAQKTGEAILVLPYTHTAFKALENSLAANAARFEELGLELVTYTALLATPSDSILPDVRPSAAKPKPVPVAVKPLGASKPVAVSNPKAIAAKNHGGKTGPANSVGTKTVVAKTKTPAKPAAKPVPAHKPASKPPAVKTSAHHTALPSAHAKKDTTLIKDAGKSSHAPETPAKSR